LRSGLDLRSISARTTTTTKMNWSPTLNGSSDASVVGKKFEQFAHLTAKSHVAGHSTRIMTTDDSKLDVYTLEKIQSDFGKELRIAWLNEPIAAQRAARFPPRNI
jgi:hypothetical protein